MRSSEQELSSIIFNSHFDGLFLGTFYTQQRAPVILVPLEITIEALKPSFDFKTQNYAKYEMSKPLMKGSIKV